MSALMPTWPRWCLADGRECRVEPFAAADIDAIAAIEQCIAIAPWSRAHFASSVAGSHWCLGLRLGAEWIAYAVFSFAAGEAELLLLGVDSKWQRQGLARQFLTTLEPAIAARARECFLEVRASNHAAIGLYESLGFHQLGERRNYYPLPGSTARETALIFAKPLGELL